MNEWKTEEKKKPFQHKKNSRASKCQLWVFPGKGIKDITPARDNRKQNKTKNPVKFCIKNKLGSSEITISRLPQLNLSRKKKSPITKLSVKRYSKCIPIHGRLQEGRKKIQ